MRCLARLRGDRRGVTVVEFGIVAPVMCLFLAGGFDMAHTLYVKAVLQGIVQKTARDSSLQANSSDTAAQATIDAKVTAQVRSLTNATPTFERRYYKTFSDADAAKAEPFTDTNKNGKCDKGEPYTDTNNDGAWDADGGSDKGGAKDRTVYTVQVSYPHMLPIWKFIGISNTTVLTAQTVLEIQPYDEQASYGTAVTRYCTP